MTIFRIYDRHLNCWAIKEKTGKWGWTLNKSDAATFVKRDAVTRVHLMMSDKNVVITEENRDKGDS